MPQSSWPHSRSSALRKKGAWEARLKLRNDEITAIGEAIKILTEDEAVDVFKKTTGLLEIGNEGHKYGFLQKRYHKAGKLQRVQTISSSAVQEPPAWPVTVCNQCQDQNWR